ncbi:MAG: MAPEG family protein [Rhodobacterales bacterium]|nr:MAPEG family protein [Rhodobacterales bacterium]
MTTELTVLTLAALLQVVQLGLYAVAANIQAGPKAAMGPRDQKVELSGIAGRLQRALNNHFEGLLLFAIAALVVSLGEQSSPVTRTCAHVYLIARILYVPAYVQGTGPWRSLIWAVGFGATVVMLIAALL